LSVVSKKKTKPVARVAKPAKPKAASKRPAVPKPAPARRPKPGLEGQLAEALEQQAATSEILSVISTSRTDAQPVFETIAANTLRLCDAVFSLVFRFDGESIHIAALHNVTPEGVSAFRRAFPQVPGRGGATQRAILTRSIVHIPDICEDPEYVYQESAQKADYRSILSVPMLREGQPIGAVTVFRATAKSFPDAQVELLKTFADQAVIAIENVRLFTELQARNRDLTDALEQQTATSEILRVISRSQTDVQPVFDTIVTAAQKLCSAGSATLVTFDGELIHLAAFVNVSSDYVEALRQFFPTPPSRGTGVTRAIQTCSVVVIPDAVEDREYAHELGARSLAGSFRSVLAVPLVREGSPIGAIAVGRPEPGAFPDEQVALLKTFADQAVIAIENVRLFNETKEALERQTATAEILKVISSSPTDVQPVFEAIVESALRLFGGLGVAITLADGDLVKLAASRGGLFSAEAARKRFPMPLTRDSVAGRSILDCALVHVADIEAATAPEYARGHGRALGFRAIAGAPLMRENVATGSLVVMRKEPGPFSDKQLTLLQTFADQAVIAIENVRLFTELQARNADLTEALEQQTATSDILRAISQSQTDTQLVFETIAKEALNLCSASSATVTRFDGELLHIAALAVTDPEGADAVRNLFPRPPSRDITASRAILTRGVVVIPDVLEDPEFAEPAKAISGGFRSTLAVPLMHDGKPIGAVAVGRPQPGPFSESQVELLRTFADQAVIAIENVRLFKELETRTTALTQSVGELRALGEVGQAISSTLDLGTVLSTIVSRATQLTGMDGGAIYEYDETREQFHLHATDKLPDELIEALRAAPIRKGEGALGQLAVTGELVQIRDIGDERAYQSRVRKILMRLGHRSLLAVPLLREDHLLGGLVMNRKSAGEFAPEVIELLKTFATQSALAIQNARLFREIEDKSRQLEVASQHKSEFLANMSHELRTPLNAIIGFSEVLAERLFGEVNDKQAEYLADILESGRHLLSLINDILDLSKIEAGRMELNFSDFNLPTAIDNTMMLLRERAHRREIALGCIVDEQLGGIHADERKVKQVLLNLLSNALKFTPDGGRIDVRARPRDDHVEISVTDTGVGIAPEDQQAVFEEFRQVGSTARKVEGTGLGLAISRKFIELHGGRIWVESELGKGSTFAFTVPLAIDSPHRGS
jgi:GAF domain-containing protein